MNFFKRMVAGWVYASATNKTSAYPSGLGGAIPTNSHHDFQIESPILFELGAAIGGRVLKIRRYDRRNDQSDVTTYVIPSEMDVGERIAKIINLELHK